ncbi:MAG: hypothetical protein ACOC0N_10205, partial [Chroococcales cyanobacterium]
NSTQISPSSGEVMQRQVFSSNSSIENENSLDSQGDDSINSTEISSSSGEVIQSRTLSSDLSVIQENSIQPQRDNQGNSSAIYSANSERIRRETLSLDYSTDIDNSVRNDDTITVAQLLSESQNIPTLPKVLDNIASQYPLGQAVNLSEDKHIQRKSTESPSQQRHFSPYRRDQMIQKTTARQPSLPSLLSEHSFETEEQTGVLNGWSGVAALVGEMRSHPTTSQSLTNAHPGMVQRQVNHSTAEETTTPNVWSSLADLVGQTLSSQSEPPAIQRQTINQTKVDEATEDIVFTPEGFSRNTKPSKPKLHPAHPALKNCNFPNIQAKSDQVQAYETQPVTLSVSESSQTEDKSYYLELLAREIYGLLRQRLEIERERHGRSSSSRLPW